MSKYELDDATFDALHKTIDSKGQLTKEVMSSNYWILSGTSLQSGRDNVGATGWKGNLLLTGLRASRPVVLKTIFWGPRSTFQKNQHTSAPVTLIQ